MAMMGPVGQGALAERDAAPPGGHRLEQGKVTLLRGMSPAKMFAETGQPGGKEPEQAEEGLWGSTRLELTSVLQESPLPSPAGPGCGGWEGPILPSQRGLIPTSFKA